MKIHLLQTTLLLVFSLAFHAKVQEMPSAVVQFAETQDLWHKLFRAEHLSGNHVTPLNGPSFGWQEFLRSRGSKIIDHE